MTVFKRGLVMLSGGQDSATCLAIAKGQCDEVYTVSFAYGQRHTIELEMAVKLSRIADVSAHYVIPINSFSFLGGSALLNRDEDINAQHKLDSRLPASFVPGRNLVFVTLASALIYNLRGNVLYGGMNQTDYSGYPDCREDTLIPLHAACVRGMEYEFSFLWPLMNKTKAETVLMMRDMGKLDWYEYTHTCYEGKRPPCMVCPACKLRQKGFEEAGIEDPLCLKFTRQTPTRSGV